MDAHRRSPVRVLAVSQIPTPYRLPLFARLAARPELDFHVVFCNASQPNRPWEIADELASFPHRVLPGWSVRVPGLDHIYELNPSIVPILREDWDAVVVGGYAVFAEQAAIAHARATGRPYLLHVESHLGHHRPLAVRAVKRAVVAPVVRNAAAGLAVGSAAADYLVHYGLDRGRVRIVPNTIDVERYASAAAAARSRAADIRAARGLPERFVVFAGRLLELKGVLELVAALELLGDERPHLVVAGTGPLADLVDQSPDVTLVGFQNSDQLIELYALAEATVVPSRFEQWGVVVNESLACGTPVVATNVVGAARDLIRDGIDGRVVQAGDPQALVDGLRTLPPRDPTGGRIRTWTYDFAVDQFLEAVSLAVGR